MRKEWVKELEKNSAGDIILRLKYTSREVI